MKQYGISKKNIKRPLLLHEMMADKTWERHKVQ